MKDNIIKQSLEKEELKFRLTEELKLSQSLALEAMDKDIVPNQYVPYVQSQKRAHLLYTKINKFSYS